MKLRIVFFGSGDYTIPIVETLKKRGLVFIVTTEREILPPAKETKFIKYLKNQEVPFISSDLKGVNDLEKLKKLNADIGILASYGAIVPQKVIDLFPLGILNIHPSLLPKYKGPSPIQNTILNSEKETGVSIIKLDNLVDHGPIALQEKTRLLGNETTESLKHQLFKQGGEMIEKLLNDIEKEEKPEFIQQDHSKSLLTKKINKEDGLIDLKNLPDEKKLKTMIRAFYPWPTVFLKTNLLGKQRIIKLLPNEKIQVEGGNPMQLRDFLNGFGEQGKLLLSKLFPSSFP